MIKLAFDILYQQGFICRANVKGTKAEAAQQLASRAIERRRAGEPVAGVAFFLESEVKHGLYPVYFGPIGTSIGPLGMEPERAGRQVVKALRRAGCWADWDGNPDHAVIVKEN